MRLFKKDVIVDEGRISIKKQTNRKPCRVHQHEFIELVYVTAGSGIHVIDDCEYRVSCGSLLFIDYGQSHSIVPDNPDAVCLAASENEQRYHEGDP